MCYVVFCVVCLAIFCIMSQHNEETAECAALHSAGRSSGIPEHCLHLNVNSYI